MNDVPKVFREVTGRRVVRANLDVTPDTADVARHVIAREARLTGRPPDASGVIREVFRLGLLSAMARLHDRKPLHRTPADAVALLTAILEQK